MAQAAAFGNPKVLNRQNPEPIYLSSGAATWAWERNRPVPKGRPDKCIASKEDAMTTFDFTPLYRSTVGFDHFADLIDRAFAGDVTQAQTYPP